MEGKSNYKISYAVDIASSDEENEKNSSRPQKSENTSATAKKRVATSTRAAAAKKRAAPKAKKTATTSSETNPKSAISSSNAQRMPLDEISNTGGDPANVDEADEFDQLPADGTSINTKSATMTVAEETNNAEKKAKPKPKSTKTRTKAKATKINEIPETQPDQNGAEDAEAPAPAKKVRGRAAKPNVILETQADAMEVEQSCLSTVDNQEASEQQDTHIKRDAIIRKTAEPRTRTNAASRQRVGSVSDTERGPNDPILRRKLGDMTKRFDALELKYNELRETASTEAESNFEKLQWQTEESSKAANDLIASLRAELAVQEAAAAEVASLKAQVDNLTVKNESLASEKKILAASLTEAQSEAKALQAKLATTRSNSAPILGADNTSNKNGNSKLLIVSNAEAAKEAQKRMLKEDLYSDLTGLIVLDVKRREEEGEDIYDCIQTGRNGTLHFHLMVANPSPTSNNKNNNNQTSYEDAEFQYTPLLDENRDKDLIEILPDYLTEEICFPRNNAAKFYSRVVDCLTKKIEIVDED